MYSGFSFTVALTYLALGGWMEVPFLLFVWCVDDADGLVLYHVLCFQSWLKRFAGEAGSGLWG